MDYVRPLPQPRRAVHLLTAAICVLASLQSPAAEAGCFGLPEVMVRLFHHLAGPPPGPRASPAARPGDILNYIDELSNPTQREQYRTLITAARNQDPPIRGLETYERVLFTAIRKDSDPTAILNTLIPTAQGRENVVADMIRHLEAHSPCHAWSICGEHGSVLFEQLMRKRGASSSEPSVMEQITRDPRIAEQAMMEQAALLARLREIETAGEIRYEDLIRLSVEYVHHNRLNFDVRQLEGPDFAPDRSKSDSWNLFFESIVSPPRNARESFIRSLLDPVRLKRAVLTFSTHPFNELEIGPPGFMITPIELTSGPVIADKIPYSSFGNAKHDEIHRNNNISGPNRHGDLHNLSYQLSRLENWRPFDQLRRELRETARNLRPILRRYVFKRWHENGRSPNFADMYLEYSLNGGDLHQQLMSYIERTPRWADAVAQSYSRRLDQTLGELGPAPTSGYSPSQRFTQLATLLPRVHSEIIALGGNVSDLERWNKVVEYASSPTLQNRPLDRRLLEMYISRVGAFIPTNVENLTPPLTPSAE